MLSPHPAAPAGLTQGLFKAGAVPGPVLSGKAGILAQGTLVVEVQVIRGQAQGLQPLPHCLLVRQGLRPQLGGDLSRPLPIAQHLPGGLAEAPGHSFLEQGDGRVQFPGPLHAPLALRLSPAALGGILCHELIDLLGAGHGAVPPFGNDEGWICRLRVTRRLPLPQARSGRRTRRRNSVRPPAVGRNPGRRPSPPCPGRRAA